MFGLVKAFASVFALASVASAAIVIQAPDFKGNTSNIIKWSSTDIQNDPSSFSVELVNTAFNDEFAIANNVLTTDGQLTFLMPALAKPGSGYSLRFIGISNTSDVISQVGPFSITENDVVSSTTSGSAASLTPTATSPGQSSPVATSLTGSSIPPPSGITVTGSTPSSAPSSTDTGSASAPAPSKFNSATQFTTDGSFAALLAAVVALLF